VVIEPSGYARIRLSQFSLQGIYLAAGSCTQLPDLNGGRGRTRTCDLLRVKHAPIVHFCGDKKLMEANVYKSIYSDSSVTANMRRHPIESVGRAAGI